MWKVDTQGLKEVSEALGLSYPVRIRADVASTRGMGGKYHGLGHWGPTTDVRLDEPAHHITIEPSFSATVANGVLHHELTHARQAEAALPENGNEPAYRVANREIRRQFGREMRAIRRAKNIKTREVTMDYADVSFEQDARDIPKEIEDIDVLVPDLDDAEEIEEEDDPRLRGFASLWRVDMWTHNNKKFVGTVYVLADDSWGAKKWARENAMEHMKYSTNLYAYPINPRTKANA